MLEINIPGTHSLTKTKGAEGLYFYLMFLHDFDEANSQNSEHLVSLNL